MRLAEARGGSLELRAGGDLLTTFALILLLVDVAFLEAGPV
jgi:hypothetical protein